MDKRFFSLVYDPKFKEKFLDNYSLDTALTYVYAFSKAKFIEEALKQDLYTFDITQIKMILFNIKPKTKSGARTYGRVLSSYINWCIEEGIKKDENPLQNVGNEWFDQFVDESSKSRFTKSDIVKFEEALVNAQDAVILRLLFEGANSVEELINIKKQDVDYKNNTILLTNKKETRTIVVSDRCLKFVAQAFAEEIYQNQNGESDNPKRATSRLVDNEYLLRASKTKTVHDKKADKFLVYRRFTLFQGIFGYPRLTAKNVNESGMLYMAYLHYKDNEELPQETIKEIGEKFSNQSMATRLLTVKNIEDLYG